MSLFLILGISLGLAMDAFAVAIASSVALGAVSGRQIFRLAFHFGLFQAMMPVIGWLAGQSVGERIAEWDHWVAFILLSGIGLKAIIDACRPENDEPTHPPSDPTRGFKLVALSTATSIDALAAGLSFAMIDVQVWYPALAIGIITGTLTIVGMLLGSRLGLAFGKRMEILGGLVLIGIGCKILFDHLGG